MKRYLILLMALATLALFIPACGGGGGGGGGGGATVGSTSVLKEIALFADTIYLRYEPAYLDTRLNHQWHEGSNLEAGLREMGHTVTPFTGVTATDFNNALSGKEVLVIPELSLAGNLSADLDTTARSVISDFVNAGGILITSGKAKNNDVLNDVFGFNISRVSASPPFTLDTAAAVGTPFEDALPQTLPSLSAVDSADSLSLPAGAHRLVTSSNGNSQLTYIPVGYGHIVIMGWDWFDAKPVGANGHGWWNVLYRAASLNANHPIVAVMHAKATASWTNDIVEKILLSGQFESVSSIDALTSTPSLATLQIYDSVLVASDSPFANATSLGNVLSDYVDGGGGVVLNTFSFNSSTGPAGSFLSNNYYAIPAGAGQTQGTAAYLGTTFYSSHPTLAGVKTFFGGSASYRANTTRVVSGAARIANWDDGRTFLATREINGVRTANLGFYPVSADQDSGFWDTTTDGDLLMANALTWVADLPEPNYSTTISSNSFPMPIGSPDNFNCSIASTLTVAGGPTSISSIKLNLDISHTYNWDIIATLTSPGSTIIGITSNNGGGGDNYENVTFEDVAGRAIGGLGSTFTPFTGSYIPEQPLASYRGEDANGVWTLTVTDDACIWDGGVGLNGWSIAVR